MRLKDVIFRGVKRVRRIAMLVVAVGALPLLIAGCFRSFSVIDHLDIKRQTADAAWQVKLGSGEGNLFVAWTHRDFTGGYALQNYFGSGPDLLIWQDHGPFDARDGIHIVDWRTSNGSDPRYRSLDLHIGYLTLILLAGAILFWRVRKHRQRRRAALIANRPCSFCGYDLRATPERCPECGNPAEIQPVACPPAVMD